MLTRIKEFFTQRILEAEDTDQSPEKLAVAALLIEVMVIDEDLAESELASITQSLSNLLALSANVINSETSWPGLPNSAGADLMVGC